MECVYGECRGWSSTVLVDDDTLSIFSPLGAITHNGTAVVVWQQYSGGDEGDSAVVASFGATWSGDWSEGELVASSSDWLDPGVTAVVALGEDLVIIGSAYDEENSNTFHWSRAWIDSTESWSDFQLVEEESETGDSFSPQVSVRGDSGVITWNQVSLDNDSYDVWARVWDASEHAWGEAVRLEEDGALASEMPIPAVASDGEAFVLWQQEADPGGTAGDLWGARFDGSNWTDIEALGWIDGDGDGFDVVANTRGDVVGVWQGHWVGTVWSDGAWQGAEIESDWFGGSLCELQNDSGDALLFWSSEGDGAYTQYFDGSTAELDNEPFRVTPTASDAALLLGCGYGIAYATWRDGTNMNRVARWSWEYGGWAEANALGDAGSGVVSSVSVAGDGSALVVWPTTAQDGPAGVVAAFFH
jgi:hypothetical protein